MFNLLLELAKVDPSVSILCDIHVKKWRNMNNILIITIYGSMDLWIYRSIDLLSLIIYRIL